MNSILMERETNMDITKEIIEKAAEGDLRAFEGLYTTYSGFVYRLALGVVKSVQDAQEVTQDVFVQIHRHLKNFRFQSSLKTWIYRITMNQAINYHNKRIRQYKKVEAYQNKIDEQKVDRKRQAAQSAAQEEKIQVLLAGLNEDQRTCIILRSIEGLSYEEIAEVLHINVNTVRSRLKRAREKMISLKRGDTP